MTVLVSTTVSFTLALSCTPNWHPRDSVVSINLALTESQPENTNPGDKTPITARSPAPFRLHGWGRNALRIIKLFWNKNYTNRCSLWQIDTDICRKKYIIICYFKLELVDKAIEKKKQVRETCAWRCAEGYMSVSLHFWVIGLYLVSEPPGSLVRH